MKFVIADMFSNEQEYYSELLRSIRKLIESYISEYVKAADSGTIKNSGGIVYYKEDLTELLRNVPMSKASELAREEFRQELKSIRECAVRSIRSGKVLVLEYLFRLFELDEFEAYLVVLSLCCELDHKLHMIVSGINERSGVQMPTLSLAIHMYAGTEAEQRKLQQHCIRRWEILGFLFQGFHEISGNPERESIYGFLEYGLKLNYRILSYIQNLESEDKTLDGILQYNYPLEENTELLIHQNIAEGMDYIRTISPNTNIFFISGEYGAGKRLHVAKYCKRHKISLLLIDSRRIPKSSEEQRNFFRRIVRESILQGNAAICIYDIESENEESKVNCEFVENILWGMNFWKGTLFLTSQYEWNRKILENGRAIRKIFIPETTTEDRIVLWRELMKPLGMPKDIELEFLADKYILSAGCIRNCVEEYGNRLQMEGREQNGDWLLEACRNQIDHKLGKDAVRIRAQYSWDDLVLPEMQKKMLKDACEQVLFHHQVYHKWGFEQKVAYGKGVSMIFYGPPGTGKTMGAQVIANTLKLELYKVDMAGVMSKYVGESEKKLGNIFEQAKKSQSILFFDEADVLFGKRTEQKDSNDKYSNASTAYLLQKIEEYEGIIILATNLLQNFDNAFLRRFKFIIEFPFTDEKRRKEIWEKVFPENLPREEIDIEYLAREFKFSGSQIKNVAVAAAFLAAGEGIPLNMQHLLIAVKRETAKTGKTMIASDFGPYYYLMEE